MYIFKLKGSNASLRLKHGSKSKFFFVLKSLEINVVYIVESTKHRVL